MVTLHPVTRALVPVDSEAAHRISAPNYDEFQSDKEIWDLIQQKPDNVLCITMAHCHTDDLANACEEGGPEALKHSGEQMQELIKSSLSKEVQNLLWIYEITSPKRPDAPQLGVGGYAATKEIRTEETPHGTIIRNEGIRPEKANGRAQLIDATNAYIGTVNLAVKDSAGSLQTAMESISNGRDCSYEATDEAGNIHRVWLVTDAAEQKGLIDLLAAEPAAYVADGNHRSAAAAALGKDYFLTVFFPTKQLGLEPYNRLLPLNGVSAEDFLAQAAENFNVAEVADAKTYRPDSVHKLGVYLTGKWYELTPKEGSYDPENAAESIDADIVQRHIIDKILGMSDNRDKRINYVGGNKTSEYLVERVNNGDFELAISLAPVTMDQFVDVCDQNRFMPPKSTWFDPKVRSGLVIALLD
ncbi:DUF1015 domain-containing protein [Thalassoglobus polymorphus]|uniref:DUF1015 domain-containing protein n=1 Tax=Thalassoglobus polymorphus TaxID=2527994 RepID=A0A517QLA5_9PLAN|nr:DUF1015 family protein [Thalassoglobus polymorphus]QDT32413.1 hypothetical protein Mal48_16590 [Thalassoglobus polymorphus]